MENRALEGTGNRDEAPRCLRASRLCTTTMKAAIFECRIAKRITVVNMPDDYTFDEW